MSTKDEQPPLEFQLAELRARVERVERWHALKRFSTPDKVIYWRGSILDLVTDITPLLTTAQLQELSGELAVAWSQRVREDARREQQQQQQQQREEPSA